MQKNYKKPQLIKNIPLRLLLVVPFVLQIFAAVSLVGFLSFMQGKKAVNNLAHQVMDKAAQQVNGHLDKYLALPQQLNQMNADAIAMGKLKFRNQKANEQYFWMQAKAFKNISYIGYTASDGREAGAGRWLNGVDLALYENRGKGKGSDYLADDQGNRAKLLQSYDFDARSHASYKEAIKIDKPIWGQIFTLDIGSVEISTSGKILQNNSPNSNIGYENYVAIPARTSIFDKNGKLLGIVIIDMLLTNINQFLSNLKISPKGHIFIIERDGLLIGSSSKSPLLSKVNGKTERYNALKSPHPLIRNIATELQKQFNSFSTIQSNHYIDIVFDNELYFVHLTPWKDEYGLDWLVVVAVPESDFMAEINANTRATIILSVTALIITIILGIFTSNLIIKPILNLSQVSISISDGMLHQTVQESSINELNILARSFNRMAKQLRDYFTVLEKTNQQLQDANIELETTNQELETRVNQRTKELENTLNELKQTQAHLVQNEKMSSLGQMVAGVAHEINNPASFIYGNITYVDNYTQDLLQLLQVYQENYPQPPEKIQALLDETDIDFLKEDLGKILHSMKFGTQRIREIVLSLRNFSRLDETGIKKVDIHQGIDNSLMLLQHRIHTQARRPEIKIIKEYKKLPQIECYPAQLNQVFINIISNAIYILDEAWSNKKIENDSIPTIWISTQETTENTVLISIADNGAGIPENIISKLFDPFFTTKPVGKGTGLGLYISYQIIVEKHRGKIWCKSTPGEGAKFVIEIPVCL